MTHREIIEIYPRPETIEPSACAGELVRTPLPREDLQLWHCPLCSWTFTVEFDDPLGIEAGYLTNAYPPPFMTDGPSYSISLTEARKLHQALKDLRYAAKVQDLRTWPIWNIRAAWLWVELRRKIPIVAAVRDLDSFLEHRQGLRICLACGCTEDNPCVDPGMGYACSWVGDFLCSACLGKERGLTSDQAATEFAGKTTGGDP